MKHANTIQVTFEIPIKVPLNIGVLNSKLMSGGVHVLLSHFKKLVVSGIEEAVPYMWATAKVNDLKRTLDRDIYKKAQARRLSLTNQIVGEATQEDQKNTGICHESVETLRYFVEKEKDSQICLNFMIHASELTYCNKRFPKTNLEDFFVTRAISHLPSCSLKH